MRAVVIVPVLKKTGRQSAEILSTMTTRSDGSRLDEATGLPVGTVKIPSFLEHAGNRVDSRSVLARAEASIGRRLLELLRKHPQAARALGFAPEDVEEVLLTSATELEFWVRTPGAQEEVEQLAVSQALQEQYWKPTKGPVRSGLERALDHLEQGGHRAGRQLPPQPTLIDLLANEVRRALKAQ